MACSTERKHFNLSLPLFCRFGQFPLSPNVNSRKISNEESTVHHKVVFKWLLASYKLTWEFRC